MRSSDLIKKYSGSLFKEFDYGENESWWNTNNWISEGTLRDGTGAFGLGSRWTGSTSKAYKKFNGLSGATIHMKIALSQYVANDSGIYKMRFENQFFSNEYTCNTGFKISTLTSPYTIKLTYGTNSVDTGIGITQKGTGSSGYYWHRWLTLDLNAAQATVKLWDWQAGGISGAYSTWITLSDNTNIAPTYTWTIKRGGTSSFDGNCISFYNTTPVGGTYAFITNMQRPHELYLIR